MDRIARAAQFFETNGRDIDRARFRFHFGSGSLGELTDTLARRQNPDGGFGHPLEPDIQAPDSNPFATEQALIVCYEAGVPGDHPVLQRIVKHLEESQDEDGNWRFSAGVYEHELAPWFQGWEWPTLNPTCTLAGWLRLLGLGSRRLHVRAERQFAALASPADLLGDAFYAVRPYAIYFLPEWEHPQRELYISGVVWWLIRQHAEGKLPDAGHFFEYVHGPETYVSRNLPRAIIEEQLDRLEAEQQTDGGWPSPYAEHWRGPSTVANLLTLRRFGRV